MPEAVIKHSKGMVSVEGEYSNPSIQVIEKLKNTKIYQQLVDRIGEVQAEELIQGHRPAHIVEPDAMASAVEPAAEDSSAST